MTKQMAADKVAALYQIDEILFYGSALLASR